MRFVLLSPILRFVVTLSMRLQSIIIDGFKSYAHRQELGDLDPHFNAITGLNGSGKSNIFDAICFVMGISNLKKVRAEDPSELIYKNGHAGIQRASVTIEFLNNDRRTAPTGYSVEEYPTITVSRQILTGGRQKFFLNGRVSDQSRVKQFFHAISLNVDNPHFLVLQGTVHKLVNMRPSEILGMLEEAAGTRVFDARRRNAENMMLGKERKVQQLNETIDTEIGPMLLAMKDAQEAYAKYVEVVESLEGMRKFRVAYGFWDATRQLDEATSRRTEYQQTLKTAVKSLEAIPALRREVEESITGLESRCEGPEQRLKNIDEESAKDRKELAGAKARVAACDKNVKALQKARKALEHELHAATQKLTAFQTGSEDRQRTHRELKDRRAEAEAVVEKLKESLRLQRGGVRAGQNGMTLEMEYEHLKRGVVHTRESIKRYDAKLQNIAKEIAEVSASLEDDQASHDRVTKQLLRAETELAALHEAYKPFEEVQKRRQELENERGKRLRAMERQESTQPRSIVALPKYDPVPGYDFDTAIRGRVASLVRVKDATHSFALSAALGGKLLSVVVTSDDMVRVLIERGRLRQRCTFLPMNKLPNRASVDPRRVRAAEEIAKKMGGWARCAVDLVTYDKQYEGAVQKVFGDVMVCSDMDVAKAISNSRDAALKCVTADAQITHASGIMEGGSKGGLRDLLSEAAREDSTDTAFARVELAACVKRIAECDEEMRRGAELEGKLQSCQLNVEQLRQRLRQSSAAAAKERVAELEKESALVQEQRARAVHFLQESDARLEEVERTKDADPKVLERALQEKLREAEAKLEQLKAQLRNGEVDFRTAEDRRGELDGRVRDLQSDLGERDSELLAAQAEESMASGDVQRLTARIQELSEGKQAAEEELANLTQALDEQREEVKRFTAQEHDLTRRIKDIESELRNFARNLDEGKKALQHMERSHPWIADEKATFGPATGPYHFEDAHRTHLLLEQLKENEALSETMSRKVNKKATVQFEECTQQYAELVQKRETLTADKEVILETIKQVEERKWASLDTMVAKVSEGFSRLFAACLPNTSCKLIDERDSNTGRLTGVAVKVAFSGKEKESLTELSGGQRSLLALCLILAILRFHPAPMYILDEVDAALDPSHTQNIGRMLKEHFSDAQFLLVSLKDGMFSNANVVYQVRNTQGYSEVSRIAMNQRR
jgi:structural maintenance of chromosome 2